MADKQQKFNSVLVYSSETGRICPGCGKPVVNCVCGKKIAVPKSDGIVRLCRETKGRKGKGVTLVTGVPLQGDPLDRLARTLKQKCGCGGTVKDGVIEIQGDHRDTLEKELLALGYKVKRAGG